MPIIKRKIDIEFDNSLACGPRQRLAIDPTQPVGDIYTLIGERCSLSNFELGARERGAEGTGYRIHPEDIIEDVIGDDERECILFKRASFMCLSERTQ